MCSHCNPGKLLATEFIQSSEWDYCGVNMKGIHTHMKALDIFLLENVSKLPREREAIVPSGELNSVA